MQKTRLLWGNHEWFPIKRILTAQQSRKQRYEETVWHHRVFVFLLHDEVILAYDHHYHLIRSHRLLVPTSVLTVTQIVSSSVPYAPADQTTLVRIALSLLVVLLARGVMQGSPWYQPSYQTLDFQVRSFWDRLFYLGHSHLIITHYIESTMPSDPYS